MHNLITLEGVNKDVWGKLLQMFRSPTKCLALDIIHIELYEFRDDISFVHTILGSSEQSHSIVLQQVFWTKIVQLLRLYSTRVSLHNWVILTWFWVIHNLFYTFPNCEWITCSSKLFAEELNSSDCTYRLVYLIQIKVKQGLELGHRQVTWS